MNTKNNKKSMQSILKIKKSVIELITDEHHENITIKEICLNAHINRTTFYSHFDDIEDVLYEMCDEYIMKVYNIFLLNTLSYKDKIKQGLLIIKDNKEFFSYVFNNLHNLESHVVEITEGLFSPSDEKERHQIIFSMSYLVSGFIGIGKTYFKNSTNKKISIDELTDIIYNIVNKNNPYLPIK